MRDYCKLRQKLFARSSIAKLIKAQPKDIVFTSGATESNNLAIKGVANFYRSEQKNHIVTVATEHKCVLEACRSLEDFGIEVTYFCAIDSFDAFLHHPLR